MGYNFLHLHPSLLVPVEVVRRLRQQDPDNQRLHDAMLVSISGAQWEKETAEDAEGTEAAQRG